MYLVNALPLIIWPIAITDNVRAGSFSFGWWKPVWTGQSPTRPYPELEQDLLQAVGKKPVETSHARQVLLPSISEMSRDAVRVWPLSQSLVNAWYGTEWPNSMVGDVSAILLGFLPIWNNQIYPPNLLTHTVYRLPIAANYLCCFVNLFEKLFNTFEWKKKVW